MTIEALRSIFPTLHLRDGIGRFRASVEISDIVIPRGRVYRTSNDR